MGHRAIRKINCLVQKSLISVISIGELTKIEDSDALTFFSDQGKNRSSRGEDLFLFFGDQDKNCSPRGENLFFFFEAQGNHLANHADSKVESSFFEAGAIELWSNNGGPQSNGPCKLSKNTKWATVSKRLRTTVLESTLLHLLIKYFG